MFIRDTTDKIEAQNYDVFTARARVTTAEKAAMVARLLAPGRGSR